MRQMRYGYIVLSVNPQMIKRAVFLVFNEKHPNGFI